MHNILIIEDDKEICYMISDFLIKHGYNTMQVFDGLKGIDLAKSKSPSLIVLDIMLPFKSGDEVLKEIRLFSDVPVIVVSAKDMIQTKVDILKLGADDYVTKPFDLDELLARIEVNIKRFYKCESKPIILTYKDIHLNIHLKEVSVNDIRISLTPKEFEILKVILENPKRIFSKQHLYELVWNEPYAYDDHTINTHMSNVRKKLKETSATDYIQTVWGMGYKLV